MRADTFKQWLEEQGCRFDEHSHDRGQGHAGAVAKFKGKKSVLPLTGTHQDLDAEDVRRVVEELGLDITKLPGSQNTETEKYRHGSKSRG
jgi:hypothetical protein